MIICGPMVIIYEIVHNMTIRWWFRICGFTCIICLY
uniref:Uncharacterized protein n=1 Tax=Aegilops tauschii subsp. strangulata TaxID=200361 RepID=A0A453R256_AEGTS